jgi:ferredoxin-NADP reductase
LTQGQYWNGETGRITAEAVQRIVKPEPTAKREIHLICGPDGFRDDMEVMLRELKIDGSRITSF